MRCLPHGNQQDDGTSGVACRESHWVLDLLSDKWTPVVIKTLSGRTLRFGELRREIGQVSQKVLATTLRAMERNGLVTRTSYAEVPPRVDYALTDLGESLVKSLEALDWWGVAHIKEVEAAQDRWDRSELPVTAVPSSQP